MKFNTIPEIIEDIKKGKIVIMVDDPDRENEGDFVMAADLVTPDQINFMAKFGRGLICTPISTELAKKIKLNPMVEKNTSQYETAFTVTIDASFGISTGISSFDRAHTIKLLSNPMASENDFIKPGHIFPLIAKDGGVKTRRGHTEASIDLMKLSGLNSVSIICEILNDDGTMARGEDLFKLASEFNLKIGTIKDLVEYLESDLKLENTIKLPTKYGEFNLSLFKNILSEKEEHVVLTIGEDLSIEPIVRIHSECLTGDLFGSKRCECGEQLDTALLEIASNKKGMLIYLRQEGRGIGLSNKLKAYALQDIGFDTVDANIHLGLPVDSRNYDVAVKILKYFDYKKFQLLTNNPEKLEILKKSGFDVLRKNIEINPNQNNYFYLKTKKEKLGHLISNEVLNGNYH